MKGKILITLVVTGVLAASQIYAAPSDNVGGPAGLNEVGTLGGASDGDMNNMGNAAEMNGTMQNNEPIPNTDNGTGTADRATGDDDNDY